MKLLLTLPFPPSVNHYWRKWRNAICISEEGRSYRNEVIAAVLRQCGRAGFKQSISVMILAHVPDKRRRDLDNLAKALLDSLCHAGVYEDDSLIDDLHIVRCAPVPPRCVGYVEVQIEEMEKVTA